MPPSRPTSAGYSPTKCPHRSRTNSLDLSITKDGAVAANSKNGETTLNPEMFTYVPAKE